MQRNNQKSRKKTLIGVLASHDDVQKNNDLARLFERLYNNQEYRKRLERFHLVFTGGTFQRIVLGNDTEEKSRDNLRPIKDKKIQNFLKINSTSLPDRRNGGVTMLANLIVQRQCSILWPFLSSTTTHWLNPENLALMRLCDIWNEKRLMNPGSVETWFRDEAERDAQRNPQDIAPRPRFYFGAGNFKPGNEKDYRCSTNDSWLINHRWLKQWAEEKDCMLAEDREGGGFFFANPTPKQRKQEFWYKFNLQTIALIAHDEMKRRMVDFAVEYERELSAFGRILATGTTGREVGNATRKLEGKIKRYRSGPKGGDIEIATEILYGRCDVVVFFIDPLNPHPHIEDIRTVFAACMIEGEVLMLTNEVQAREWMDSVVRPKVV